MQEVVYVFRAVNVLNSALGSYNVRNIQVYLGDSLVLEFLLIWLFL